MNKKHPFKIFFASLVFCTINCQSTDTIEFPVEEKSLAIVNILPLNPKIGDKLKIVLNKWLTGNEYDGFVFFDNNWSYSDSIKNDTIFTFLPYIKNKSSVEVKVIIRNDNRSYELTKNISIANTCNKAICVIKNDEGNILEKDIYPKGILGENPKWKISSTHDTITISAFRIIADEANQTISLKFINNASGLLPTFINYTRKTNMSDGASPPVTTYDTLKNGLIKIEDWNNNGIYSGKIYAEIEPFESKTYFPPKTVFWLNIN